MSWYHADGVANPVEAKSIRCYSCAHCPAVHIDLLDENGFCFATAVVPTSVGHAFVAQFHEAMETIAMTHPAPEGRQ